MSTGTPFMPARGSGQKVTATTTSQTIPIGKGNKSIRVLNAGAVLCYFVTYDSTAEAAIVCTSAQTAVGPAGAASSTTVIEKKSEHDTLAYIADSATAVMHFQAGEGGL